MSANYSIGLNLYGNDVSASSAMENFASNVESSSSRVEKSTAKVQTSLKNAVTGVSALATSAYGLYLSYDKVVDMSLQVERANLAVSRAEEQLDQRQKSLNEAVAKYGADSEKAKDASDALALAQDALSVATERANQTQENQTQASTSFYLGLVPQAITMMAGISSVFTAVTGKKLADIVATDGLSASTIAHSVATKASAAAQWLLNAAMSANPIMLVVMALAALTAGIIWAYQNCEWFRNGINAIGSAIYNFFKPAIDAVSGAIQYLGGVWDAVLNGMVWIYDHTIGPLIGAIQSAWSWLTGAASAGASIEAQGGAAAEGGWEESEYMPTFALGGVMPHTGMAFLHEGEVILPPNPSISASARSSGGFGNAQTQINSPLIYIEGSADEKTAKMAANMILKELRRY